MNSIIRGRFVAPLVLVPAIAALASVAVAQEEAPAEETGSRLGNIYIDFEQWVAQPTGLDYFPATLIDPNSPFSSEILAVPHGTDGAPRYRLDYAMPSEIGNLVFTVYTHEDRAALTRFSPAEFIYGETLTQPLFAGVNNDDLADGFASATYTKLRDLRVDFYRPAFRSPRVAANWFVGWRRVRHARRMASDYYALVPDFPPLLPPGGYCPDPGPSGAPCKLNPIRDTSSIRSSFEGRGATIGMDLEFPLWKNNVVLEGDVAVSVMRGKIDTEYTSVTSLYVLDETTILDPPYDEFDDVYIDPDTLQVVQVLDSIDQYTLPVGLQSKGISTTSEVYEASLGFRWRTPLKRLEVYGGIRQSHYADVGLDLRPKNVVIHDPSTWITEENELTAHIEDVDRLDHSVTYEGFYGGVRVRLY
jgi:hypothetical protein